jgi:AraC-like DNA-binding protein
LLKVGALLKEIAQKTGPDTPCRIVAETEDIALVQVGRVALGSRTPAEALTRIAFALPFFCSHELLSIEPMGDRVAVRHAYGAGFDSETLHLMTQYALAVLDRICAMSGALSPRAISIELPMHPEFGVSHLAPWFDLDRTIGTDTKALTVTIEKNIVERPFPRVSRDRSEELARLGLAPLRNGGGFSDSVRTLLSAMFEDEDPAPTLVSVAEAAGMSPRTVQRRLNEEGQTFKLLLDGVRQDRARRLVADGEKTIGQVARRLGYSRSTSLNRSMMRWTGKSPTSFRRRNS